jgi:hypothetical protein
MRSGSGRVPTSQEVVDETVAIVIDAIGKLLGSGANAGLVIVAVIAAVTLIVGGDVVDRLVDGAVFICVA